MSDFTRLLLFMLSAVLVLGLCGESAAEEVSSSTTSRYNVKDYGAVGNGQTDDTQAFQNAMNAASAAGGGVAFAPRGNYLIATHLTIPENVTLEGIWTIPTAWSENK